MSERVFTLHVCPACGYYVADPILRRADGIRCYRCGQTAVEALDLRRVNPNFHHTRRKEARDGAPLMVATRVAPMGDTGTPEATQEQRR